MLKTFRIKGVSASKCGSVSRRRNVSDDILKRVLNPAESVFVTELTSGRAACTRSGASREMGEESESLFCLIRTFFYKMFNSRNTLDFFKNINTIQTMSDKIDIYNCPKNPTVPYMVAVMQAFEEGKQIEFDSRSNQNYGEIWWQDASLPSWNWDCSVYRVKSPVAKYGYDSDGKKIEMEPGYELIPEGEKLKFDETEEYYHGISGYWCANSSKEPVCNETPRAGVVWMNDGDHSEGIWIAAYARKIQTKTDEELLAEAAALGYVVGAILESGEKIEEVAVYHGEEGDHSHSVRSKWETEKKPFVYVGYERGICSCPVSTIKVIKTETVKRPMPLEEYKAGYQLRIEKRTYLITCIDDEPETDLPIGAGDSWYGLEELMDSGATYSKDGGANWFNCWTEEKVKA